MCHYFRHFGVGRSYAEGSLRALALYRLEFPNNHWLESFRKEFPTLFECLEAKFSILPSSERIVEQKNGQLRHSLKDTVGNNFTDHQQQCLTNVEY